MNSAPQPPRVCLHQPVSVLTHHLRQPLVMQGGATPKLAEEPDGQRAATEPAHAAAARRSDSALRRERTLRMPLSRVLRL